MSKQYLVTSEEIESVTKAANEALTAATNASSTAATAAENAQTALNASQEKVATAKIADGAVTRAKLANDARYSPVINKTDSFSIVQSEVGSTYFVNASGKDVVVSVSRELSSTLSPGADFAIFWFAANSITIELNNCRAFVHGDSTQYGRIDKTVNVVINEVNSMTAIKKLYTNPSYGDVWTVLGDVEVTTV